MPCGKSSMKKSMLKQYGKKKGTKWYYATKNKKGTGN